MIGYKRRTTTDNRAMKKLTNSIGALWRRFIRSGELGVTASQIKQVMFEDIHCINFMRERRNECLQMQGRYDGAMSEDCRQSFREQYEFWDALIKEEESARESVKLEKSKRFDRPCIM